VDVLLDEALAELLYFFLDIVQLRISLEDLLETK
jgi:hypothetical protein